MMKKLLKEYEAPLCDVVLVDVPCAICTSPGAGTPGAAGANGYVLGGNDNSDANNF